MVPCLSPQPCLPRAVPWPTISLKPLSSRFACQDIVQSSWSEAQASPWQIFRVHPWRASRTAIPADCSCTSSSIPADAQLLRTTPLSVNRGTTPHAKEPRFEDAQVVELAWGVPHSPEVFVAAAVKAGHPKTLKPPSSRTSSTCSKPK